LRAGADRIVDGPHLIALEPGRRLVAVAPTPRKSSRPKRVGACSPFVSP